MFRDAQALSRLAAQLGVVLMSLAFVSALFMGSYPNPRTALAAHVIGITGGLFMIAAGQLLPRLRLSRLLLNATFWSLTVSVYLGFATQLAAATFDLTRMFVVTAVGRVERDAALEGLVEIVIKGITPLTMVPCLLIAWGLRGRDEPDDRS